MYLLSVMGRPCVAETTNNGKFSVVLTQSNRYNKNFGENLVIVPTAIGESGDVWGANLLLAALLVHEAERTARNQNHRGTHQMLLLIKIVNDLLSPQF